MKANNKNKLSALYQNIIKKEFNFSKWLKQMFFVSLSVILVAVIVFAFIGFNTSYSFSKGYQFNVKFNTEITKQERETYSKEVIKELKNNNISNYELTQIGESYDSAILVSVKNNSNKNSEKLVTVLEQVSNNLESTLAEKYSIEFLKVSEVEAFNSSLTSTQTWSFILAIVLVMAVVSAYMYFRYDTASMLSNLIVNANNVLLLLSLITVLRVPVSTLTFVGVLLTQLLTSYFSGIYFSKISEGYDKELFNNISNSNVSEIMVKGQLKTLLIIFASAFALSCALLGISLPLATELAANLLIGVFLATFTSIFVTTWVWSTLFNKDKDKRFKVRQLKKNAPKKTEEEQIVV